MSGLQKQIEALIRRYEDRLHEAVTEPTQVKWAAYSAVVADLRDVLALLAEQPPKRWIAEVEDGDKAIGSILLHDGGSFYRRLGMPGEAAESLAAQINGEA